LPLLRAHGARQKHLQKKRCDQEKRRRASGRKHQRTGLKRAHINTSFFEYSGKKRRQENRGVTNFPADSLDARAPQKVEFFDESRQGLLIMARPLRAARAGGLNN
jgi:hypothetical protein